MDFTILHLSDLHIKKTVSKTLRNLIADIKDQVKVLENIILVVSGDIIDKGDYDKNREAVIQFFQSLYEATLNKVIDVQIVPGNHDKIRSINTNLAAMAMQTNNIPVTNEEWKSQNESYTEFLLLVSEIYKIFKKRKNIKQTYGVELLSVDKLKICFIRMDSAWISYGAKIENHTLLIGEYQREKLVQEYQKINEDLYKDGEDIDMTFCVVHHPTSFLKPNEEEMVKECLIDNESLNVDFLLCGHTHERAISNWFNHERSVTTLVTGIGWDHNNPNSQTPVNKEEHRYSLYNFDKIRNTFEIIMRKSKVNGSFDLDYSFYTSDSESSSKEMIFPLKFVSDFPAINIKSSESVKRIFLNNQMLDKIVEITDIIIRLRIKCSEICERYKHEYLERLSDFEDIISDQETYLNAYNNLYDHFFDPTSQLSIEDDPVYKRDVTISFELFTNYLQEISNYFAEDFSQCFDDNVNIRAHFRLYNSDKDAYEQICSYSNKDFEQGVPRDASWGGIIKEAFTRNSSVVYSSNKHLNNITPVQWDDFITIIPRFHKYEHHFRDIKSGSKKGTSRPILTFALSVKTSVGSLSDISMQLYIMEYLGIDNYVTDIIDGFIKYFPIEYCDYVDYRKTIKNDFEKMEA